MNDVKILSQACCAFRNLFLKLLNMDHFRQSLTISSICNKVFRTMFLKPDTRYYSEWGYRMGDRQTAEAIQWLVYIGRTRDDVIHAGNWREVHLSGVPNVKVDGYSPKTQEVFDYFGCYCHGCPCVPNRHKPIGSTGETLYWNNQQMHLYAVNLFPLLSSLYMFREAHTPIIRSTTVSTATGTIIL